MGMNYYLELDKCPTCGHAKERIHIGKSSMGWSFSFHGIRDPWSDYQVRSYQDWLELFSRGQIFNEDDEKIEIKDFKDMIERKKDGKKHMIECQITHPEHARKDCWLDEEGNSFSEGEFS